MMRFASLSQVAILLLLVTTMGCGLIGVGLRLDIQLTSEDAGTDVDGSTLFIAVHDIDAADPPGISGTLAFRTTGTVGRLELEELVVTYAEIVDEEPVEDYTEVHREELKIDTLAVGGVGDTADFSFPLPSAMLNPLKDQPETLIGRTFAMRVTVTGPTKPPVTGFQVKFVEDLP